MILADRKTKEKLFETALLPCLPIPEERAEQLKVGKYIGKSPPYCPDLLVLEKDETKSVRAAFLVDKYMVEKIGVNENGTVRVFNAEYSLKFVDKGLGITFVCADKGHNNFKCRRSSSD